MNKARCVALLIIFRSFGVVADEALDRSLLAAAAEGNTPKVEQLLRQGANPNYIEPLPGLGDGYSPLYRAVSAQSIDCVRRLLAAGADPLKVYERKHWMFPLAAAFQNGVTNKAITDLLLNVIKSVPGESDPLIDFVIHPAAGRGDTNVMNRLEILGARLGAVSKAGNTVFIAAAEVGHFEQATGWLSTYADQYRKPTNAVKIDEAVEYLAAHPFDEAKLVRLIVRAQELGLHFVRLDRWGTEMWKRAAGYRLPECARLLGCPPEEYKKIVPRSAEELALAAAYNQDSLPVFTNLLQNVLRDAKSQKDLASRLLFNLLDVKHPDWRLQMEALEFLVSNGANVSYEEASITNGMRTPLEAAAARGEVKLMQWMIDHGADINHISGVTRLTPLDWALSYGNPEVVRWMLAHGARIQEKKTGHPLLATALRTQNPYALIPMLLKAGADPYAGHEEKKAAIDIMAERHDIVTLRKLDTKGLYRDLIKQYTPPADSPFVGVWWNEKDEFKTFGLILNQEGMAMIETSIMPLGFFPWRTSAGNRAVIEAMEGNKPEEFIVEWLPAENALKLISPASDEAQILKKQPEKPLTVEEYRKKAQSK